MAAPQPEYVELHAHSAFSFLRAGSSVEALVARAAALGMPALALTDFMTLAGVVRFQAACAQYGIRPIVGVELAVADPIFGDAAAPGHLVALAQSAEGYARLCQLLSDANLARPEAPSISFQALAAEPRDLILLTGGRNGPLTRLVLAGRLSQAEALAARYADAFGPERVFVELQHHRLPESMGLMHHLSRIAEAASVRCVATNGAHYATRDDYALYDLLTCVRLGITVDQRHTERPRNDEAYLKGAHEMAALFAALPGGPAALAASEQIAARCELSLLKGVCTAPHVPIPDGHTPTMHLRALCTEALVRREGRAADAPTHGATPVIVRAGRKGLQQGAAAAAIPTMARDGQRGRPQDAPTNEARRGSAGSRPEGLGPIPSGNSTLAPAGCALASLPPTPPSASVSSVTSVPSVVSSLSPYRRQLEHELAVIERLELEEFFLCVADITRQARAMGIRCSGRGSAANSLVAYLLGITGVDPIQHHLLFERFLNPDRKGMPDIDVDVQSDRRDELIRYVEQTYTKRHSAMVANVNTYRARGALRDAAKALAYPLPLVNRMCKLLHHHAARETLPTYRDELAALIRAAAPSADCERCLDRLPLLLGLAARLIGLPRHLSLHNGGIVLSREPLSRLLPVRLSANGVRALEVDKDDVERLGLIKFDLLGLRTLGAIEEALMLIEETTGQRPDVDHLPTDPPDPATMHLIRAGQTLAVFQIESPGQWHLLAQTQPQTFDDLIVQTALFRPGPIQGGFVHPYVLRRQARQRTGSSGNGWHDAVQTPWHGEHDPDDFWTRHPVLGPILRDTEGILLFQEQILEIAHHFAGLSYAEADGFRRAMSHARAPAEMEAMRGRFVAGAAACGESPADATRVFEAISHFVGYGFCRSHAAEFARTIYATAWLKAHYPAHYLAAFLSSQPAGFFPPHVVLEEARLLGIPILQPDINRSEERFTVEAVGAARRRWAIRISLRQVAHVGDELAEAILWERRPARHIATPTSLETASVPDASAPRPLRPFVSLADACTRLRPVGLTWPAAESLVLAGAFDGLHPGIERRRLLWHLRDIWPLVGGKAPSGKRGRAHTHRTAGTADAPDVSDVPRQLALNWSIGAEWLEHVPRLPALDREERAALDYALLGLSPRPHPMRLLRRELRRGGVRAIAELGGMEAGRIVRVAGWPISAQRPPTAKGMGFLVLEDETGRLPVALPPKIAEQLHRVIRDARVVVVRGRCERVRWYRSLLGFEIEAAA
ncbi:MAG TPA: DNA polymerase III subunit alpha [Ktedonobacterales bacterium]|nr:DNA polymerase III subunit alpha [Ktedonobacterales bacterium]